MEQLALPAPNDQPSSQPPPAPQASAAGGEQRRSGSGPNRRKRRRASQQGPLTREAILEQLAALKGMVAAGWIKPAAANAMTRILQLMLQCLERGGPQRSGASIPEEILADAARRDPAIFELLEPFLTDEQINAILDEFADNEPETGSNPEQQP